MSFTDTDQSDDEAQGPENFRKELKRLKAENKELRERAAKAAEYEQREAFVNAGVPVSDPRLPYFMAGYKGDQTPEAIKAEWESKFGPPTASRDTGQEQEIEFELGRLTAAQDMTTAAPNISPDKLAERDQKLAALSQTDPHYPEKFNAIFESYGGKRGGLVG